MARIINAPDFYPGRKVAQQTLGFNALFAISVILTMSYAEVTVLTPEMYFRCEGDFCSLVISVIISFTASHMCHRPL